MENKEEAKAMLGMRIAALRRQKNWSQKELAERMGVRPSTIGMYEQGRREPDCAGLVRLAELFGVTTDYLLTGDAADGRDAAALRALWAQVRGKLDGTLLLRDGSGVEKPFGEEELAILLAALLGEAD